MTALANVVAISKDAAFIKRAEITSKVFEVPFAHFDSVDDYAEKVEQHERPDFIILSATDMEKEADIVGRVQVAKYVAPRSSIVAIAQKKVTAEQAVFIKKSGAAAILIEDEFQTQSKIEFVFSQKANGALIPVKASEFLAGKSIDFTLLHLMPMNHKFVQLAAKGQVLQQTKIDKMNNVGEFYIDREDYNAYVKYISENQDKSAKGLKSRCRVKYQNLVITFKDLVNLITDRAEAASFQQGKKLLEQVQTISQDLVTSLADSGDVLDVVNASTVNDLSVLDRVPAISAYAGIFSLMCEIGTPDKVMACALLADIGLLELTPDGSRKLMTEGYLSLGGEDMDVYKRHHSKSLNACLARKLPIAEDWKNVILGTGIKFDKPGNLVPMESQLILFCEVLDREAQVALGKPRLDFKQALKKLLDQENSAKVSEFSPELLHKAKELLT